MWHRTLRPEVILCVRKCALYNSCKSTNQFKLNIKNVWLEVFLKSVMLFLLVLFLVEFPNIGKEFSKASFILSFIQLAFIKPLLCSIGSFLNWGISDLEEWMTWLIYRKASLTPGLPAPKPVLFPEPTASHKATKAPNYEKQAQANPWFNFYVDVIFQLLICPLTPPKIQVIFKRAIF